MRGDGEMPPTDTLALRREMIDLVTGCWTTQVIGAATKLGVPEALADGPLTAAQVGEIIDCPPGPTRRLLRAMCSLDLARQIDADTFASTERGTLLRRDIKGSFYGLAQSWTGRLWNAWSDLEQGVRTGRPQVWKGAEDFAGMAHDPVGAKALNQAQADRSLGPAKELARVYDFPPGSTLLDVGGGYGVVLAEVLKANPTMSGAVFDLPYLEPQTLAFQAEHGVTDRAAFTQGDFFKAVPGGSDYYVLKSILHDWPDEKCRSILETIARGAKPGAIVLVIDQVLPEIADPDPAVQSAFRTDLTMLVGTGGLERTEPEIRALLKSAGLELRRIVPNRSEFSILEATID